MAKVGPLKLKLTVDPAFLAAVGAAVAALEALGEQLNRTDLVKAEIVSEGHGG